MKKLSKQNSALSILFVSLKNYIAVIKLLCKALFRDYLKDIHICRIIDGPQSFENEIIFKSRNMYAKIRSYKV